MIAGCVLGVALITLTLVTGLARRTFDHLERGAEARQQAYDVLIALRRVRQDIGEMRVGAVGYVLTGDSVYLGTYRSGVTGLARDTSAIRRLTAGTASLQSELDRLQPELVEYAADLEAGLRTVRSRPRSTYPAPIVSRSGMLLEEIRPRFAAIETEQIRLLDEGASEVRAAVARTNTVFAWVLAIDAVLIVAASLLLFVHLRGRARAEAELAHAREQLQESRRLEAIGQLAGGVAHDFNNILTVVTSLSDLIGDRVAAGDPTHADVSLLRQAANRGSDLTRQLLAVGRRQVLEPKVIDLNEVVREFRPMLELAVTESVRIAMHLAPDLGHVRADPRQLEQVLMNLAVNGRDAMVGGGQLTIETANAELDESSARARPEVKPGHYVVLIVSDTGAGMDAATRARIFEPFFTTKELGKGTGLGLATVYGIVKQSEGHIWVYSEPSHGTTFKVYLPRVDAALTSEPVTAPTVAGLRAGGETILLVEDDPQVREVTERILTRAGYRVIAVGSPAEALERLAGREREVHLLLSDVVLPGMSGPQLAREAMQRAPGLRVLYQSGYSDAAIAGHGALDGGAPLLHKPFTAKALRRRVREVLEGSRTEP